VIVGGPVSSARAAFDADFRWRHAREWPDTDIEAGKTTVSELHGSWPKWSRIGQPPFRYLAAVRDRWFTMTVVCVGALTVVLFAVAVFWH
jgi:hypothetical protein